jgi:2-desacetyl-2-hydroxyethyl bacteriochlorophyllide A dehydrogenase
MQQDTCQAWVLPKAGDTKVFQLKNQQLARPRSGEIRVEVHFSGINFADILMRQGLYPDAPAYPFVPGYEVSGIVESVGEGVETFKVGDLVYAGTAFGGYSSKIILPTWQVMHISKDIELDEAAGIPVSAITAYNVLFEQGNIKGQEKVLVDCASGALGQMVHSMLSGLNVELWGLTSSDEKKKWLVERGVKALTHEEFSSSNEAGFDLILNSLGGRSVKLHYSRLAPLGRIVCIGAADAISPGRRNLFKALKTVLSFPRFKVIKLMNDNKGVFGLNVLRLMASPEIIRAQLEKIQDKTLISNIDRIFSYRSLELAHAYLEGRHSRGKVLLDWRE